MIPRTLCTILFLLILSLSGCRGDDESSLRALDKALSVDYPSVKIHSLDSIRRLAALSADKWRLYDELAANYANFNTDSALFYNSLAHDVAPDALCESKSELQRASIYNSSMMMYKEAHEIFRSIAHDSSDSTLRRDYFILGVQLYRNLELLAPDDALRREYAGIKKGFRDSVLKIMPDEKFIRANELLDAGDAAGALKLFERDASSPDFNPANGAMYHMMARAYGRLGNSDAEREYLALAAKADIENGVREYVALPQLALRLYERGDIDRAYRYMQRSIEDAKACNARVRLFDMTDTLPAISNAYAAGQRSSRIKLGLMLGLVCVLLVITVVSLYYARQRNRLLSRARAELEEGNRRLAAAGNIREKYVRRFMYLSREYLEKLDGYRARLFKIAAKRNFDALADAIKSPEIVDRTAATFYANFDKAFLELYPDFIEEFNSLLRPEERVRLKSEGELNTDLRIFALMKLGITESAEIARFLHCSQSTVYNYRTRYRTKAIDKDIFVAHFFHSATPEPPTNTQTSFLDN